MSAEILLGVTGSIAAYKACDIIRRLKEHHVDSTVVMTQEAQQFLTALTLEALSGRPVYSQLFRSGDSFSMPHIQLLKNTKVFLIAPATANMIGKLAHGIADDLLSCLFLSARIPVLIAPAMNEDMYHHPALKTNIEKLQGFGVKFILPVHGSLACGVFGDGHIADTDDIVKAVLASLNSFSGEVAKW